MAHSVNPESSRPVTELPAAEASEAVTGHEVAGGATEVAEHGGEGGGLPQFRVEYWGGQIIWLLILFALLYGLLSRVFIPRLRRMLDEREDTIQGALATARQVQTEADAQAEAARNEVAQARASAQRTASEAKAAVEAESAQRAAAESQIAQARDQALSNVRSIAGDTAEAMVERLTGEGVTVAEMETALDAVRRAA